VALVVPGLGFSILTDKGGIIERVKIEGRLCPEHFVGLRRFWQVRETNNP